MKQALTNLLSNAIKYTRPRSLAVIEVGYTPIDGKFAFFVRDNGIGFEPRDAAKAFAPFQRLQDNKDFEGSSVGPATVHRIIQKIGGKIWAQSEPGLGSPSTSPSPNASANTLSTKPVAPPTSETLFLNSLT
jgi:signal transduction histidine kinase